MIVPSADYLQEVERHFAVSYPRSFWDFCATYARQNIQETYPAIARGSFITDCETLKTVNARIGFQQWSDLERAIAGKIHPKDGMRLWGELLPIYVDADCIYGFYHPEPHNSGVYVWSVHCIVHGYPDLDRWLEAVGR